MQQIDGRALAGLANLLIEVHVLPCGQTRRLILRQVGLHGEIGLGKMQRSFQVLPGGHVGSK